MLYIQQRHVAHRFQDLSPHDINQWSRISQSPAIATRDSRCPTSSRVLAFSLGASLQILFQSCSRHLLCTTYMRTLHFTLLLLQLSLLSYCHFRFLELSSDSDLSSSLDKSTKSLIYQLAFPSNDYHRRNHLDYPLKYPNHDPSHHLTPHYLFPDLGSLNYLSSAHNASNDLT